MTVKLLIEHHLGFLSLKGGCTGSSESILVKIPHCWKLHVTAHIVFPSCLAVIPLYPLDIDRWTNLHSYSDLFSNLAGGFIIVWMCACVVLNNPENFTL